jgi:hypothetical protein
MDQVMTNAFRANCRLSMAPRGATLQASPQRQAPDASPNLEPRQIFRRLGHIAARFGVGAMLQTI